MPQLITAAVQRRTGDAPVLESLTIDDPRDDEVLVAIRGVGVCHTDMVMRDGHLPIPQPVVLGHEGSGIVERVGKSVKDLVPGDHVVLSFNSCGSCRPCIDAEPAYCHSWFPMNFGGGREDGSTALRDSGGEAVHSHIFGQSSFASHVLVHRRNTVKVDKDLPIELLGPLGCGIQTGAGTILNVLKPGPGDSIAIIGTGAVGLSAVMAAALNGVAIILAVDLNPDRLVLARKLGATHAFKADTGALADFAKTAGIANGLDFVIDTTGIPAVCNAAIDALGSRGELALVGAYPPSPNIQADASFLMSGGRVIRGVVEGGANPQTFIPQLIEHHRQGRFPIDRLVEFFNFANIAQAIHAGETGRVVKPIILMATASEPA